ncbi:protein YgfX [Psychromonas ossibalaenae]|uniref:protein YgfX n=1 Tax=Psychromonas ossibalaenae TaxID=444922 RepID=UPI00035FEABE|nr:protein YgfX [Psychromonas ossibalaenae]
MLSSSALKYNIVVSTSVYGGVFVFALYFSLILFILLFFEIIFLTVIFVVLLLVLAVYAAGKAYAQTFNLKVSDAGDIEVEFSDTEIRSARISNASFYNGFCIYLSLHSRPCDCLSVPDKAGVFKTYIVIYRDAVTEKQYRLLARLVNIGRDLK